MTTRHEQDRHKFWKGAAIQIHEFVRRWDILRKIYPNLNSDIIDLMIWETAHQERQE